MTETAHEEPPPRRRGCCLGRILGLLFVLLLLLGIALVTALYIGWPQRAAVRYAAGSMGLDAEVGRMRLTTSQLTVSSLSVHRQGDHRDKPMARIEHLRVDFSAFDRTQPPVTAISIGTLGLWLDDNDFPEADDSLERPARTPRTPSDTDEPPAGIAAILEFLPRTTRIDRIEGGYRQTDLAFEGGPVAVEMTNPGDGTLQFAITGTPALMAEHAGERFESSDAQVDLLVAWAPEQVTVEMRASLPPWAELDSEARFSDTGAGWEGLIEIASARVDDLPAPLRALIPMDADAQQIMVAPSRIAFFPTEDGYELGASSIEASGRGVRLGPEEAPWFWGDPAIEMTGEGQHFKGKLAHDDARSIEFDGTIGSEMSVNVALSGWTYADIEALTPVDMLDTVALFSSLHHLDARTHIAYRNGAISFSGILNPAFGLDPAWHDKLRLDAAFAIHPESGGVDGVATLELAGDAMILNVSPGPDGGFLVDAMAHNFDLPRLAQLLALAPPEVRDLESLFSGTARIAFDEHHIKMVFEVDASPPPFLPFETLRNSTVAIQADITAPPGFAGLSGAASFALAPHLDIRAGDLRANLETAGWSTRLTGTADLGAVAAYLDLGPLAGDMTLDTPLRGSREAINADLNIVIDGPAYDGLGLGYGDLLTIQGAARYPFEGEGTIQNLLLTAGEGTRITAPEVEYTASPLAFHAQEFQFTSDGLALISAGYLDGMTGALNATGSIDYDADSYRLTLDYSTAYDLLTLRNALAVISGGSGEGHFELTQDGLGGEGVLTAEQLAVFGVTLERVRVPITFEPESLRIREFEAGLFNGRVLTNGRIGVLEEGMPVELTARLRSVDLAPFSEAFLSPDTRVTGIANGTVRIQTENMQVTGFEVSLRSARDFTINRDFLAQLIMQEQVGEAAGRAISSVLAEVLGEARQRPFDAADIELALRDGLIRGTAVLSSSSLNLTVNLSMDPRHVGELMRMNQRSELERLRSR